MKTEPTIRSLQDRPATWEEIRRATSSSPDRLMELCYKQGNYCEVDSDLGGVIRYPSEEFEFFAYLSEMDDTTSN
jgi:hypothetical protein